MAPEIEIYREAMKVIQQCGADNNPKEYAFAQSSLCHEKGDMEAAERWAKVANAVDLLLQDVTEKMHIPVVLH